MDRQLTGGPSLAQALSTDSQTERYKPKMKDIFLHAPIVSML